MHRALEIQEILLNIFEWERRDTLASLARTCHAFEEPALDLLWRVLPNLSPLARCLPDASYRLPGKITYAFSRPLAQTESDLLYRYTRRIRSIIDFHHGLDLESVMTFLNPPTTRPLFPNLRTLHCTYTKETMPLLHLPLPSLVVVDFSPNIRKLSLFVGRRLIDEAMFKIEPNYMCRWQNLTSVVCPQVALDVHALVHLSSLTELAFTASITTPYDSPIFFPNLHNLTLQSESLEPISHLLSQIRLSVMKNFDATFFRCPSRLQLSSFWANFQTATISRTIEGLQLTHSYHSSGNSLRSEVPLLSFEDLQPCTAFSNLRLVDVDIGWSVGLTDGDLLTLTMAWPRLEGFSINLYWGWSVESRGITPSGLLQVLQTCRSLKSVSLAIDTRGYTEFPPPQAAPGLTLLRPLSIRVLDSVIDAESVPAMAAFFAGIAPPDDFYLCARHVCVDRWGNVCRRVCNAVDYHS
ncbi:hypothetical protein EV363DRAFT_1227965 [Boletus edulis]|nr:hypothetical protein EV363DRAFT_1227965 [Boletus edulis]